MDHKQWGMDAVSKTAYTKKFWFTVLAQSINLRLKVRVFGPLRSTMDREQWGMDAVSKNTNFQN